MSKYKIVSYLFVILGVLVIAGASYVIYSYASGLINAIVNFVTTNDFTTLQQCGVTPPSEFNRLKAEFATLILPALYVGLPLTMITVSALMFLAGFYYHRGRLEDEARKQEVLEREMVHKIVQKMEAVKGPAQKAPMPQRAMPQRQAQTPNPPAPEEPEEPPEEPEEEPVEPPKEPPEEPPEEPEEEPEEKAAEEEQDELPRPKRVVKKRK